ncbi:MAG: Vitamin B12-binding protein [Alphaproteobacteria bacterium MarineAlpha3_Bin5]|nr:cobalamin-binding protein [Magnetovibrio sp.]PPR77961.1 MAG: Vitamin B12-binding protein [Alphaproteobacteria bacterium MarineAlpha3_Bin5]
MPFPFERIICLTEETVETLYLLGEEDRIVGVSGYAVRPKKVRREKPRVSAFTSANIEKIIALKPDLVLTFSDLQADIASALIKEGIEVHGFNQRSIKEIFNMIRCLGSLIGEQTKSERLAVSLEARLNDIKSEFKETHHPLVYFEEWDDPLITGITWVSELIEIAGGIDVFKHLRQYKAARDRIVTSEQVISADPDIIIASWCGKKVQPNKIIQRKGWSTIPAVASERIFEIKSPLILQPGPAALTEGLDAIIKFIRLT